MPVFNVDKFVFSCLAKCWLIFETNFSKLLSQEIFETKKCNIFVIVTQLFCYVMLTRCVCYGDIMMMFHDDIFIINSNMTKYRPLCSFHERSHERSTEKLLNCIAEITSVQLNWFWYKAISKLSNVCDWRSTTCDCQCVCASESIYIGIWDVI